MTEQQKYREYLNTLKRPHRNLCRLEFLQPDGSVAFALGTSSYKRGYNSARDTRALVQDGELTVQLQNGQRRKATVTLSNLDNGFSYNINNIWFGQQVKLLMGVVLSDGTEFYLPQGVFYISNPEEMYYPSEKTVTLNLVDKWAYLDGTLMGQLGSAYVIPTLSYGNNIAPEETAFVTGALAYSDGTAHSSWGNYKWSRIAITNNKQYTVTCESTDNSYVEGVLFFSGSPGNYSYMGYKGRAYYESDSITFTTPPGCTYLGVNYHNLSSTAPQVTKLIVRGSQHVDVFDTMRSILHLSRFDRSNEAISANQYDNVTPVFSDYWNDKYYTLFNGAKQKATCVPYEITVNSDNGTLADLLLELNTVIAGLIGYDETGALRVEPSQDDISDISKAVLWEFSPENSILCGISETNKNNDVYNEIICVGTGLSGFEVYGKAQNFDPRSDTNINLIGVRTEIDPQPSYWNAEQCIALAEWNLKQKTILQKTITIECAPLFHLHENQLISVRRTDKEGSPVEKHLIQSFSLPIGTSGSMTITCASVNDFVVATTTSSELKQTDDTAVAQN